MPDGPAREATDIAGMPGVDVVRRTSDYRSIFDDQYLEH